MPRACRTESAVSTCIVGKGGRAALKTAHARAGRVALVLPHLVRDFARERDREALLGPLRLDPLVQEVRRVAESVRRPDHLATQLREEHVHPSEVRVRRLVHKVAQERGLAHGISRYARLEAFLARDAAEHDCVRCDCLGRVDPRAAEAATLQQPDRAVGLVSLRASRDGAARRFEQRPADRRPARRVAHLLEQHLEFGELLLRQVDCAATVLRAARENGVTHEYHPQTANRTRLTSARSLSV